MKKKTTLLILFLLPVLFLSAQTFEDWSHLDDKKFSKTAKEILHNTHEVKKFYQSNDELPKFRKIGLLCFSVFDPVMLNVKYNMAYSTGTSELTGIVLIDRLFDETFQPMTVVLKDKHDCALMLPDEYCDTPEKTSLYRTTEFELSNLFKATKKTEERIRSGMEPDLKVDIPGLKRIGYASADPKVWRAVGKLAGEFGLDGFLIIENLFNSDKKAAYLMSVRITLIGPNPVPYREENEKKFAPVGPIKGYLEGLVFGSVNMIPPKDPIQIFNYKTKEYGIEGAGQLYARSLDFLMNETKNAYAELEK